MISETPAVSFDGEATIFMSIIMMPTYSCKFTLAFNMSPSVASFYDKYPVRQVTGRRMAS